MIPDTAYEPEILKELSVVRQPSLGWGVDFENNRITGEIDNVEAVKQAIYLILSTERYSKPIYTWNYGIETYDLYEMNKFFIVPNLQKRVFDAVYQDDRVTEISNFQVDVQGQKYIVTFDVATIYGDTINISREVNI